VTIENRDAFRDRLLARGRGQSTVYAYWRSLKHVARVLVPDPPRQPKAVRERLGDRGFRVAPLPPPAEGTVRYFCETIYKPTQLISSPDEVLDDYTRCVRLLYEHAGRDVLLSELSDVLVGGFLRWLLKASVRRPVTVNRYRAMLMAIWGLAAERHEAPPVQRVRRLKIAVDAPDSFSRDEMRRIIDAPALIEWRKTIAGMAPEAWWRAFFLVAFYTGMRVRTLLALRVADVNLETGIVTAAGDTYKTGKGQRYLLPQEATLAVAEILQPARERLFAWSTGRREFHKDFRKILAVADVSPSTRRRATQTHRIRRTIATEVAAEHGAEAAARLLGNTPEVCRKHYIDPTRAGYSTVAAALPPITDTPAATPTEELFVDPQRAIDEAHKLYRAGHLAAAAVTARTALHAALYRIGKPRRITCKNIGEFATALAANEIITRTVRDEIHRVLKTANRGAHGRVVNALEVIDLVNVVKAIVASECP
jgi:integrase